MYVKQEPLNEGCAQRAVAPRPDDGGIAVLVQGTAADVAGLLELAGRCQDRFRFTQEPGKENVRLRLTDRITDKLYYVSGSRGVVLSSYQSEGIAMYLGISRAAYLLMGSLIGLTQWRALVLNPLLRVEDFAHREPATCAFATQSSISSHVLALEQRNICPACRDFFFCLGAEAEVIALQRVMAC